MQCTEWHKVFIMMTIYIMYIINPLGFASASLSLSVCVGAYDVLFFYSILFKCHQNVYIS